MNEPEGRIYHCREHVDRTNVPGLEAVEGKVRVRESLTTRKNKVKIFWRNASVAMEFRLERSHTRGREGERERVRERERERKREIE